MLREGHKRCSKACRARAYSIHHKAWAKAIQECRRTSSKTAAKRVPAREAGTWLVGPWCHWGIESQTLCFAPTLIHYTACPGAAALSIILAGSSSTRAHQASNVWPRSFSAVVDTAQST